MYVHKSKLQIQMFSDAKVGVINKPKSGCNAAIEPRVEKLSAALFLTLTTALVFTFCTVDVKNQRRMETGKRMRKKARVWMGKWQCITVLCSLQLSKTGTDGRETGLLPTAKCTEGERNPLPSDNPIWKTCWDGRGYIRQIKMNEDKRGRRQRGGRNNPKVKMNKSSCYVF